MAKLSSEVIPNVGRILENLIFLGKVFESSADEEIPNLPFLELAQSFELKHGFEEAASIQPRSYR